MHLVGRFRKSFDTFEEGFRALLQLSGSVSQSVEAAGSLDKYHGLDLEVAVVRNLAENAISDRQTGNGVGWNCRLSVNPVGAQYMTHGGLVFGWTVNPNDFQWTREEEERKERDKNSWEFFIQHPNGVQIREGSTLRQDAIACGWEEGTENPSNELHMFIPEGGRL